MKVYCKNCAYRGFYGSFFCTYEDRYTNTGDYYKKKADKNADGNCKHYKTLWWKFWLSSTGVESRGK
jgi:hypothetical protein